MLRRRINQNSAQPMAKVIATPSRPETAVPSTVSPYPSMTPGVSRALSRMPASSATRSRPSGCDDANWLAIVATTVAFFRRSKVAGWLMVPYLAWVSFASVLNFTIWRLNVG